ncbi:hypothetical protein JZO69_11425 [Enterococcus sp. DIV0869a]|uniref:Bacteriophage lysin domain-containing protein n=1 Tax=Candidatus Enterococcus ikei TaxID=2815326 RepID=A0ABS3H0C6_9ENTE|nr:hypothetical protein [Enterococcus sp. DIV0869a]
MPCLWAVFIWGDRGNSGGAAGHTGIFIDDNDNIIHCNYGFNGITVNNHDYIWEFNGQPLKPKQSTSKPQA